MKVRSPYELVLACERQLGAEIQPVKGAYAPAELTFLSRKREAIKVAKALRSQGFSLSQAVLALNYCVRTHQSVPVPLALLAYIPKALDHAPEGGSVIDAALAWERLHQFADWEQWTTRLIRSRGAGRAEVLKEWQTSRRGRA
jgi:hypothetical protein